MISKCKLHTGKTSQVVANPRPGRNWLQQLTFLAVFTLCLYLLGTARSFAAEPSSTPVTGQLTNAGTALQITAGPYLQAPSETGMTIAWSTSHKSVSKVEYRSLPDGQIQTAVQSRHGLVEANTTFHAIRLTGLKPGTRYAYHVVSTQILDFQAYKVIFGETIKSPEYQFTTLDRAKDHFSFVVLNDRHENVEPLLQGLNSIRWDRVDLVVYNGDMLNYATSEDQLFQKIIHPSCQVFATRIPFVLVRGNHDARGSFARRLLDYFPTTNGCYYFSLAHGGVHFVVLDSGEDKSDASPEYSGLIRFEPYIDEETTWLRNEIQTASFRESRFRVVLSHMPPQNQARVPFVRGKYLSDNWGPLFKAGKIDLLLCAHTHRYAEMPPAEGKNPYLQLIGGTTTIIRVDVTKDQLSVTSFNNDGSTKSTLPMIARQ